MSMRKSLLAVLVCLPLAAAAGEARPGREGGGIERPAAPVPAQRRSDQAYARDGLRSGTLRPLREITTQWRVDMPGYDFIGSEYDPDAGSYRLKFMRGGAVVWVDVDGRGREIRRSDR